MLIEVNFWYVLIFIILIILSFFVGRYLRHRDIREHREDAVSRSRAVLSGQFSEQLAPYLPNFKYSPTECRFIGKPIDFLVFKGLDSKNIDEVIFVEVKSGKSNLNGSQKSLKEAINKKKVRFEEYRVDEDITK